MTHKLDGGDVLEEKIKIKVYVDRFTQWSWKVRTPNIKLRSGCKYTTERHARKEAHRALRSWSLAQTGDRVDESDSAHQKSEGHPRKCAPLRHSASYRLGGYCEWCGENGEGDEAAA